MEALEHVLAVASREVAAAVQILKSQRPGEFIAKRHTMRTFENGCLKGLTELSSAGLRSKSPDRVAVGGRKIDTSCRTLSLSG